MSSSDYLTNLSRSELADKLQEIARLFRRRELDAFEDMDALQVAARRLRELDQRDERIEALSAQVRAADKRALASEHETARVRGNLERERDTLRERIAELEAALALGQANCDDIWAEKDERIADLESEVALWKHNDAQARRDWNADKACASQVIDVFGELTEMHTPQEAAEEVKRKLLDAMARVAELEAEVDERHAKLVSVADKMRARIAELEAEAKAYHEHMAKWEAQLKADAAALAGAPAPAERTAQDDPIVSWTIGQVLHALDRHMSAESLDTMAAKYLREKLATLDAVEAFAELLIAEGRDTTASRLRMVLNGKR